MKWGVVAALLLALAGSEATASPTRATATPDHFACYPAHLAGGKLPVVSLKNQFGGTKAVLAAVEQLCSPARKNGGAVRNKGAHLVCYTLTHVTTNAKFHRVEMTNQFGTIEMAVVTNPPASLCVPSGKRKGVGVPPPPVPTRLDTYLCYSVDPGAFKSFSVKLADQFGSSVDVVGPPRTLCVPTSLNGRPILDRVDHLLCYRLQSRTHGTPVVARNRFGVLNGALALRDALCVPSTKVVLS